MKRCWRSPGEEYILREAICDGPLIHCLMEGRVLSQVCVVHAAGFLASRDPLPRDLATTLRNECLLRVDTVDDDAYNYYTLPASPLSGATGYVVAVAECQAGLLD